LSDVVLEPPNCRGHTMSRHFFRDAGTGRSRQSGGVFRREKPFPYCGSGKPEPRGFSDENCWKYLFGLDWPKLMRLAEGGKGTAFLNNSFPDVVGRFALGHVLCAHSEKPDTIWEDHSFQWDCSKGKGNPVALEGNAGRGSSGLQMASITVQECRRPRRGL